MALKSKIMGLKELDKALGELSHVAAKGVARRVLKKAAKPIASEAAGLAPAGEDLNLKNSISVSTRLNKRQRKLSRKTKKGAVTVHVGTNDPAGVQQEYGNVNHGPQPFMRSAWSNNKRGALEIIKNEMSGGITKAAARARKRALKKKGR